MNRKILLTIGGATLLYGAFVFFSEGIEVPKIEWLLLLFSFTLLNYFFRSVRWKILLERNGLKIGIKEAVKTYLAGLFFIITPGKIGEVAKAELMKEKYNFGRKKGIFVVITERFFDIIGHLILALISALFVAKQYLGNLIAIFLFSSAIFIGIIIFRKKITIIKEEIESIKSPFLIIFLSFLSAFSWLFEALEVYLLATFLGAKLSILEAIFAFCFSVIIGNLLLTPGGIGGAEVSMTGFLVLFGLSKKIATTITLIVRLSTLWFGFALGALFWFLLSR